VGNQQKMVDSAFRRSRGVLGGNTYTDKGKIMEITEKDIGKWVEFRALCRWNSAKAIRKIRGISPRNGPVVSFGGYKDFTVHPHEVIEVFKQK